MSSEESLSVVVRVRPMVGREHLRGGGKNRNRNVLELDEEKGEIRVADCAVQGKEGSKKRQKNRNFKCAYDKVFGPETDQDTLFRETVADSVDAVVKGINCTVFAYGQTGTGKTYTILGEGNDIKRKKNKRNNSQTQGIIPRAVNYLFQRLANQVRDDGESDSEEDEEDGPECNDDDAETKSTASGSSTGGKDEKGEVTIVSSMVYCSYLQIYNEQLFDLLQDQKRQFPLKIRCSSNDENYVQGLSEIRVSSLNDIYRVLKRGGKSRAIRATEYNESSSRSHAILKLRVELEEQLRGQSDSRVLRSAKFNFVDLAGSEKWDTAIDMCASRKKELTKINNSLSALGNVIQALGEKDRVHVPYRDSRLTHLLQDSLGGNTRSTIICTLSPAADCIEETVSTLQFADRAKRVMVSVKVNELIDDSVLLARAQIEIARLKRELRKCGKGVTATADKQVWDEVFQLRKENRRQKSTIAKLRAKLKKHSLTDADVDETDKCEQSVEMPPKTAPGNIKVQQEREHTMMTPQNSFDLIEHFARARDEIDASALIQGVGSGPAPSDILHALKDELEEGENDFIENPEEDDDNHDDIIWGERQETAMKQAEHQCYKEIQFEMGQLESIQSEREKLEEAIRLMSAQKQDRGKQGKKQSAKQKQNKKAAKPESSESVLAFSSKDVGLGVALYQCRVDSWYKVDIINYDPKSGMHCVRYREDQSKHWHQMSGRKYKLIPASENGKSDAAKTLLRDARAAESKRTERKRIKRALQRSRNGEKTLTAYGGLQTLYGGGEERARPKSVAKNNEQVDKVGEGGDVNSTEMDILGRLQAEGLGYASSINISL